LLSEPISKVEGEMYEINRKELLEKIDEFEGAPDYYQRKRIKVKSHHGVKFAYTYLREDVEIPQGQQPLKVWENNADYKVQKVNNF